MNSENSKLGRGLGALLSSNKASKENQKEKTFKIINTSSIIANPKQPRKNFEKNDIEDLASSIKSKGILQPILVREKNTNVRK